MFFFGERKRCAIKDVEIFEKLARNRKSRLRNEGDEWVNFLKKS